MAATASMIQAPSEGVVAGLSMAAYQASPAINNGQLKAMAVSMADYFALHERPDRPPQAQTAAMRAGTLMHCATLEPGELDKRYVVAPNDPPRRPSLRDRNAKKPSDETVAAIQWWDAFAREHAGKELLTAEDLATAYAQRDALLDVPEIAGIVEDVADAWAEISLFWRDAATGVLCRCRPDKLQLLSDGRVICLDLKQTAHGIDVDSWTKTSWNMGYHRQAAHYIAGIEAALQREVAAFVFGVVRSEYPFLADSFILRDEALLHGQLERERLLRRYVECKAANEWPAFGPGPKLYGLPRWVRA